MKGNKRKLRERVKSVVAWVLTLVMLASLTVNDMMIVTAANVEVTAVNTEATEFYPGNDYEFTCEGEGLTEENLQWGLSEDTLGEDVTITASEVGKAVLHISENVQPETTFKVTASAEDTQAESDEIVVGAFAELAVENLSIEDGDGTVVEVKNIGGRNWMKATEVTVKPAEAYAAFNQSWNGDEWEEIPEEGITVSGVNNSIRFRNSETTQITNELVLNCDNEGPTVEVTAQPEETESGWTNQQIYTVTANDGDGCGECTIYYYDADDAEKTPIEVKNGEVVLDENNEIKNIVFYAEDALGNRGEESAHTVNKIEKNAPKVTVAEDTEKVKDGETYLLNKASKKVFQVTAEDADSLVNTFTYEDQNGTSKDVTLDSESTLPSEKAEGTIEIIPDKEDTSQKFEYTVKAADQAGNVGTCPLHVLYDPVAPTVTATLPKAVTDNNGWISAEMKEQEQRITIEVSDADAGIETVSYQVNGSDPIELNEQDGSYSLNIIDKISEDGEYTFTFTAVDKAGNSSTAEVTVHVDTTAPTIDGDYSYKNAKEVNGIFYFNNENKRDESAAVTAEVTDAASGLEAVTYKVKGVDGEAKPATINNQTVTMPVEYVQEGTVIYELTLTDKAGNTSTDEMPVYWDTEAPKDIVVDIITPEDKKGIKDFWNSVVTFFTNKEKVQVDVYAKDGSGTGVNKITGETNEGQVIVLDDILEVGNDENDEKHEAVYHFSKEITVNEDVDVKIVSVTAVDNVGNTEEDVKPEESTPRFVRDTKKPVVELGYGTTVAEDGKVTYFQKGTSFTVKVTEQNFDPKKVEVTVDESNPLKPGEPAIDVDAVKTYFETAENWVPDEAEDGKYICTYETFEKECQYEVSVTATDLADNKSEGKKAEFVVDKTPPEVELSFADEGLTTKKDGITYFKTDESLTVTVDELNFDPAGVKVIVTESNPLNSDEPAVNTDAEEHFNNEKNWITNGTKHSCTYTFKKECQYKVSVTATDLAGNTPEVSEETFVVDKTVPAVEMTVTPDTEKEYRVAGGRTYYDCDSVNLTITVTEHNFYTDALESIVNSVQVESKDIEGTEIALQKKEKLAEIIKAKENWEQDTSDTDKYVLKVPFSTESNYTIHDLQITDMAGNPSTKSNDELFTIDRTKPIVTYSVEAARTILNYLTFGYFGKENVKVTATLTDDISGVYGFSFKPQDVESKKPASWDKQLVTGKPMKEARFYKVVNPDFKGKILGKAEDYSQNETGADKDLKKGVIVESADRHKVTSSLNLEAITKPNKNGFYNSPIDIGVSMQDKYSGIYNARYGVKVSGGAENLAGGASPEFGTKTDVMTDVYKGTLHIAADETYYSNDITAFATFEDNAGNVSYEEVTGLKLDYKAPEISVSYNNDSALNGKYYNRTRVAEVVIKERNFDESRTQLLWTSTGSAPTISGWSHNGETHTAYVTFSADADYTFTVKATDLADNFAELGRMDIFTVDQTAPSIQVSYDNNNAQNGNYYNAARTATVQITEHNFNASEVQITGSATEAGAGVAFPATGGWSSSGDVHTATIYYSEDAHYTFTIAYTDLAGNAAAAYPEEQFVVDKTQPTLTIQGVKNESANNQDKIGFVLTAADNNFGTMTPQLSAVVQKEDGTFTTENIPMQGEVNNGNSHSYRVENLETDGIYTLSCGVTDLAGNRCDKVSLLDENGTAYGEKSYSSDADNLLEFSVNRHGSVYRVILKPKDLNDKITNEKAENISVIIEEINADELDENHTRLDLYNGLKASTVTLKKGTNYQTGYAQGNGGWRKYTYTLNGSNFEKDGNYQVGVYSVDKAGNESDSLLKEEAKAKIAFIVDRTNPELNLNVQSRDSYNQAEKRVELSVTELHQNKKDIHIKVNGEKLDMKKDVTDAGNGQYEFVLGSGINQEITVSCTDQAGNESEISVDKVTVSTNIAVRAGAWMLNNIGIVVVIVCLLLMLIAAFVVWRMKEAEKRKIEIDEE